MISVSNWKHQFVLVVVRRLARRSAVRFHRLLDRIRHLREKSERLGATSGDPLEAIGHIACSVLFLLGTVTLMQGVLFRETPLSRPEQARLLVGYVGLPSAVYYLLYFVVGRRWPQTAPLLAFGVACYQLNVLAFADTGWPLVPHLALWLGGALSMGATTVALTLWPWRQHFQTARLQWTKLQLELAIRRWQLARQRVVALEDLALRRPELRSVLDQL